MARSKQARIGDVQTAHINDLRAELLRQAGGYGPLDLTFTDGANLAVVIGMAHLHAPHYRDEIDGFDGDEPIGDVAAEIVSQYLEHGDVPESMKRNYGTEAKSFATTVVQSLAFPEPGVPDAEWFEERGIERDRYYEMFTAESPGGGE